MATQTVTRTAETDLETPVVFATLSEAGNIPLWAPVFADKIDRLDGDIYRVEKGGETFQVQVIRNEIAGTVDYLREMANGKRGGAYIRVMPRPMGGSTVTMTVPMRPTDQEASVGKVVEQELSDLLKLARDQE